MIGGLMTGLMRHVSRFIRRMGGTDCFYCMRGDHHACDSYWLKGCLCRDMDDHVGVWS